MSRLFFSMRCALLVIIFAESNGLYMPIAQGEGIVIGNETQILIDDFVIQETRGLVQRLNPLVKHPANPVIVPDQPWEGTYASPISAFYDAEAGLYRMWYRPGDHKFNLGYITSRDGLAWDKPALGLVDYKGSKANSQLAVKTGPAWNGVLKDDRDPDAARRYKLLSYNRASDSNGLYLHVSSDGLNWTPYSKEPLLEGLADCHTLMGWDANIKRYVAYVRPDKVIRTIARTTSEDMIHWTPWQTVLEPDDDDPPGTQFYGMTVYPDRGVYFGLLWVYHPNQLMVDVQLAFSRDGIKWQRAGRRHPIMMYGLPNQFDSHLLIPLQPIRMGDELKIFYIGYNRPHAVVYPNEAYPALAAGLPRSQQPWLAGRQGCGGLATCLRDRFVSWDVVDKGGELITKPLRINGKELRLNVDSSRDEFRVEVLDENGTPIPGFEASDGIGVRANGVAVPARWRTKTDLTSLQGKTVQFRILLRYSRLYSFEVAP